MPLKRLHIIPLAFALAGFGFLQQSSGPATTSHEYLGFSLLAGANSSPVTYHIVCKYDDPAIPMTAENITSREFIAIAYGWGDSPANPTHENLFDKYEIAHCGYFPDTVIHMILYKGGMACSPTDNLWKLAHSEWPFTAAPADGSPPPKNQNGTVMDPMVPGPGWAREPNHPSDGQVKILQEYGAIYFIDIIYGENAFHLLHDMQDPTWVSRYTSS
jgi:hypothetical protein